MASRALLLAAVGISVSLIVSPSLANDVYSGFPVTVKGYDGDKKTSLAYTGQIARHVLHDSLKKLAGQGNGSADPALKAKMLSYYTNKDKGRSVIAPKTKGPFIVKQTAVDGISGGKNLAGKTYKG
jgi:hypothetical protein